MNKFKIGDIVVIDKSLFDKSFYKEVKMYSSPFLEEHWKYTISDINSNGNGMKNGFVRLEEDNSCNNHPYDIFKLVKPRICQIY